MRSKSLQSPKGGQFVAYLGFFLWLFGLSLACYSGGAYDADYQVIACVSLALGFALSLLTRKAWHSPPAPVFFLSGLAAIWLLWVATQLTWLPRSLVSIISPWTIRYQGDQLGLSEPMINQGWSTLSLIPANTVHGLAVYGLAAVVFLVSAVLINEKRSRIMALAAVMVSCLGIASWGIVQRLLDARDLPPGVPRTNYSSFFAGFSNENTGAACVCLGAAAAFGLLLKHFAHVGRTGKSRLTGSRPCNVKRRESPGKSEGSTETSLRSDLSLPARSMNSASSDGYAGTTADWADPRFVAVVAGFAILLASVVMSLSRGATLSVVVAVSVVSLRVLWSGGWRLGSLVLLLITMITYGTLAIFGAQEDVVHVQEELSPEKLSLDARWEHWKDGWKVVERFPATGTGLNTYGYSQLVTQDKDSPGWIREAHNQYLEWLAEVGCIGFAVIVLGAGICLVLLWSRIPSTQSRDVLAVRTAALCALIAAMLHSFVDFSYAAPSNLWLLSCLIGMGIGAQSRSLKSLRVNTWQITAGGLIVSSLLVLIFYVFSMEADELRLLQKTLPEPQQIQSTNAADVAMTQLDQHVERFGASAPVARRQAVIGMQQYKRERMVGPNYQDHQGPLSGSVVRGIERRYYQHLKNRLLLLRTGRSQEIDEQEREDLLEIRDKVRLSIQLNPLHFRSHILMGEVVTLLGEDAKHWFNNCQQLNRARPEVFYACGLFASWSDDDDTRDQQWRRCLSLSRRYDNFILPQSMEKVPADRFAKQLAPRPADQLYSFAFSVGRKPGYQEYLRPTVSRAIEVLKAADQMDPAVRANRMAHLLVINGDQKNARKQFELAISTAPKNLGFRLDHASHLARTGYAETALSELKIASALDPQDPRADALIKTVRKQVLSKNVDKPASNGPATGQ